MIDAFLPFHPNADCDPIEDFVLTVEGKLSRDFGPWKAENHHELVFDFDRGLITEYNPDGKLLRQYKLILQVGEEIK